MSDNISPISEIEEIQDGLERQGYLADDALSTVIYLMLKLKKPLMVEGNPGVGKTDIANRLAIHLQADLIRLQCYEGLDINTAVYEWNYQKQLLAIKFHEQIDRPEEEKYVDSYQHIFSKDFLLSRPLLSSITNNRASPVLLIDEIDRADEEFEAFLLELLSEFQISIPELGTLKAKHPPYVILTSNRTRELSDALRRRCLYHWIDYPSLEKELSIVRKKFKNIDEALAKQIVRFVQKIRTKKLSRPPGIAETLDWTNALLALHQKSLSKPMVERTLACLVKSTEDNALLLEEGLETLISGEEKS